jgi:hypothetical protein
MSLFSARTLRRRGLAILGVAGMLVAFVGVTPTKAAGVVFKDATFSGSAVGSAVHADALTSGTTRVANAEVAIASAAVNTKGLTAATTNENGRQINPAAGANRFSYGRGAGLEVGLVGEPGQDGQIILAGKSEGSAPCVAADGASCTPPNWHDSKQIGPVPANPVAWASLVNGISDARWNTDTCVLGDDISRGFGYAADAQLLDTGSGSAEDLYAPLRSTDATDGRRDVVQTVAREALFPNSKGDFGLKSIVEQTLAPVTLFRGTPNELTIEVLGEWELTAFASGVPGESKVSYLPEKTDTGAPVGPETPILRIIQPGSPDPVTTILDFQTIFGPTGLDQIVIPGVAEIAIGEDPRAIGGDASTNPTVSADGTSVSAAVDVVRVRLLDGSLGDIRVGHMEAKATVPAGGITCPIPVSKTTPNTIVSNADATNGWVTTITVKNAFGCTLEGVTLTDDITRKSGDVSFEILESDTRNDPKKGAGATFTKVSSTHSTAVYTLGDIPAGASKVVKVVTHATSGGGIIEDIATAKGTLHCGPGSAIGEAKLALAGTGVLDVTLSRVLARTGGEAGAALWLGTFAFAAVSFRRYLRTRKPTA